MLGDRRLHEPGGDAKEAVVPDHRALAGTCHQAAYAFVVREGHGVDLENVGSEEPRSQLVEQRAGDASTLVPVFDEKGDLELSGVGAKRLRDADDLCPDRGDEAELGLSVNLDEPGRNASAGRGIGVK